MNEFQKSVEKFIAPDLKERYRDFKYVGQGGMGRIVSAHDTMLDKRVAIKLLPAVSHSDTALVRFHQEAKAISKLKHLNIVTVLDFGFTSTEEPYLVMDYIDGTPLDTVIEANETIPLRTAIQIATQICDALEHAHFNGVIHRDLKPSNVMLIVDEQIRILDFGLAKLMDQTDIDHRLTRKGQALGSPLFMSPEQVRGEDADERADVYGLGMLLYKMITGKVPLEDENIIVILRSRLEEPPPNLPPNSVTPVLTDATNEILQKALAPDPANRFQNMKEFKAALEDLKDVGEFVEEIELKIPRENYKLGRHGKQALLVAVMVALFGVITGMAVIMKGDRDLKAIKEVQKPAEKIEKRPKVIKQKPKDQIPTGFEIDSQSWWKAPLNRDEDFYRLLGSGVKRLNVSYNPRLTAKGMEIISDLNLDSLSLEETRIGDESIDYLNKMNLKTLDIRSTRFSNAGLARLAPSKRLVELDVAYMKHFDDKTLALIVKKFPNLRRLIISNTLVTAKGLATLKPLRLTKISASGLKLTDKDMDIFTILNPEALDLEGNFITQKCIPSIKRITNLKWVGFDFTAVPPDAVAELKRWKPDLVVSNRKPDDKQVDEMTETLFNADDHI